MTQTETSDDLRPSISQETGQLFINGQYRSAATNSLATVAKVDPRGSTNTCKPSRSSSRWSDYFIDEKNELVILWVKGGDLWSFRHSPNFSNKAAGTITRSLRPCLI